METSKDRLFKKIVLYCIVPVILVIVCVLIYFIVKMSKDEQVLSTEQLSHEDEQVPSTEQSDHEDVPELQLPIIESPIREEQEKKMNDHAIECKLEQYKIQQIQGTEDKINNTINQIASAYSVCVTRKCIEILSPLKTFNFYELMSQNHQFDKRIASLYVKKCFHKHKSLDDFRTFCNSISSCNITSLVNMLYNIFNLRYKNFKSIVNEAHEHCSEAFNKIPNILDYKTNCHTNLIKIDIVEIVYFKSSYFYGVGGMSSAVEQWGSNLLVNFNPEDICYQFDKLIVLAKLHLDDPDISKIAEAKKSLCEAEKFMEINNSMGGLSLTTDERAELILHKLGTINGVDMSELGVKLFFVPTSEDKTGSYFAGVRSLKSAIGNINNLYTIWGDKLNKSPLQCWISDTKSSLLGFYKFDINKCRRYIAVFSKFIMSTQTTNPKLGDDQLLINATNAILLANEILTIVNERNAEKLRAAMHNLRFVEYLKNELSQVPQATEMLLAIDENDSCVLKLIIPILMPLRYLGAKIPILRQDICIVQYKNGVTGDIYYRFYSIYNEGNIMDAIDLMQPMFNCYNGAGNFDIYAFYEQIYRIYALARNMHITLGYRLPADTVNIVETFENLNNSLLYHFIHGETTYPNDKMHIYVKIIKILSKPEDFRLLRLAREISPSVQSCKRDKEKLLVDDQDRRIPFHNNNRLPFYSNLHINFLEQKPIVGVFDTVL